MPCSRCYTDWDDDTDDEVKLIKFHDHYVCENCLNLEQMDDDYRYDLVFPYGYWPKLQFKGNGSPYLGLELECYIGDERIGTAKSIIEDTDGWAWCVHDNSCDMGFEVNAHPFTLEWLKQNKKLLESICKIRRYGYRGFNAGSSCGMHVHIGVDQFDSKLHQYKYLYLFREFPDFIKKLSRRTNGALRDYSRPKGINDEDSAALTNNRTRLYERGSACYNKKTIEVRIFRSTLHKSSILANLEIIQAAFMYTKTSSVKEICPNDFMMYIDYNKGIYPDAYALYSKLIPVTEYEELECA